MSAIEAARVVPVVTLDDPNDAPPLVGALIEGGLHVAEITLRTGAGLDAIRRAVATHPDAIVGAGSVTSPEAAAASIDAGARFLVSPGLDEQVVAVAQRAGVPILPGIATATELMRAINLGVQVTKVFPAEVAGGVGLIRALADVWPTARFMPTGGISAANARAYLELPSVIAIGGSWMVPRSAIAARDWASIRASAGDACELGRGVA